MPEVFVIADGFAEEEDAEESAEGEEDAIEFEDGGGDEGGAGAEAADDEANTHDETADDAGPKVGGVDPDEVVVEEAEAGGAEN